MRKELRKWIALGMAGMILTGTFGEGSVADAAKDKLQPMVTLSMDKCCEAMVSQAVKMTVEKAKAASGDLDDDDATQEEKQVSLNLVYDRLGIASKVDTYLNVRKKPSEDAEIVGKLTKNAGCNVYKINKKGWAKIVSGKVNGWVKAEYMVTDAEAEELAMKVGKRMAVVNTETLNARALPSTNARIVTLIAQEEDYTVHKLHLTKEWMENFIAKNIKKKEQKTLNMDEIMADLDNWMCIRIDNDKVFVNKEYVKDSFKLKRAVALKQDPVTGEIITTGSESDGGGNMSMVSYAMQFLGNRYVYGGTSLTNGTDCSGFTMRIYEHFGKYIPRVAADQAAAAYSVSDPQPGDLFFYGSGGYVNHVAMYIGNGQVIHASNEIDGIKISYAYYRTPVKIGRY